MIRRGIMTLDRAASMRVRSHLRFHLKLTLQPDGDRTVVGQRDSHMRAENAGLDAPVAGAGRLYQSGEQLAPPGRGSGGGGSRAPSPYSDLPPTRIREQQPNHPW